MYPYQEIKIKISPIINIRVITILLLLVLLSANCEDNKSTKQIPQGIIQYEITYLNQSGNKFQVQLLPKTMELMFNKDFSSYTIEDPFGLLYIKNILNYNESKHITLVKFWGMKYVYIGNPNEPSVLFNASNKYKISYFDDTMRMVGLLCKKAEVNNSSEKYDIYYTKDIPINKPNKTTPYEAVDGMLLNFRLQIHDLEMQLKAKKIEPKTIENNKFEIPNGYKIISRERMNNIITQILQ